MHSLAFVACFIVSSDALFGKFASFVKPVRISVTRHVATLDEVSVSTQATVASQKMSNDAIIVGSGPIGLATAIMLARQGVNNIQVFDQLSEPYKPDDTTYWGTFRSERSYNIGVTGRGQIALRELDVWQYVEPFTAEIHGSAEWTPTTPIDNPILRPQERRYSTRCIERDRLTGCLLQAIQEQYKAQIQVSFNQKCTNVAWYATNSPAEHSTVELVSNQSVKTNWNTSFLIGCDGTNSVVRDKLLDIDPTFRTRKYDEINEYVYRTVPIKFNCSAANEFCPVNKFISYSQRSSVGLNLESLPTKEGLHLGVLLYRPDNSLIRNMKSVEDARKVFNEHFPVASAGISDQSLQTFVASRDSRFQRFQYVYPKLHFGSGTVMLGDSIHTVKPYFGLGVNSGLEDVIALQRSLRQNNAVIDQSASPKSQEVNWKNRGNALQSFTEERAKQAKALVKMSQRLDRGFVYFILPIIIDSIFHKSFPWLFEKSIVSCLQDERRSFTEVLQRKQIDRFMQLSVVITVTMAAMYTVHTTVRKLVWPLLKIGMKKIIG